MLSLPTLSIEKMHENAERAETLLKSLANANRLMILCHLIEGERNVGELETRVGLSQSALSQHLARLKEQGIVTPRKSGAQVFYSLADQDVVRIMQLLYSIYCE